MKGSLYFMTTSKFKKTIMHQVMFPARGNLEHMGFEVKFFVSISRKLKEIII